MLVKMNCENGGGTKTYELSGQPPAVRIDCGFPPRIIMVFDSLYGSNFTPGGHRIALYWNKNNASVFNQQYDGSASTQNVDPAQQLYNIDDTGFNLVYAANYSSSAYIVVLE